MNESRSKKTIKNAKIALVYYFINLFFNFFSRKIFIDKLGTEVLGLNTTASNLLGFLNISELGIGAAISYTLYTPLFEEKRDKICDIISIQGWLYRKVAYFIIIGSIILMFFFPLIFAKADVPLWYTFAIYSVLLFSSLIGYLVNYRQILLTADQKDYKVIINIKGLAICKIILQIVVVYYLSNGYVYWLLLEVIFAIISSLFLNILLKNEYPWLGTSVKRGEVIRKEYPDIILKTKQLFAHKIGNYVLQQTSPVIIYGFASLTLVAIYGNYMLIIMGISALMNALFNSITAGVGNLVAEGDRKKIKDFFWQLASFRFWLAAIFSYSFYLLAHPFICLWIGEEFLLEKTPFILLTVYLFLMQTRICDIFINAYGLYNDIWAPVIEAIFNVGLSVFLGYFFGLSGIILGVIISLSMIVMIWKPFFLFKFGIKASPKEYYLHYMKYIFLISGTFFITKYIGIIIGNAIIFHNFFLILLMKIFVFSVSLFLLFIVFDNNIKYLLFRIKISSKKY